MWQAIRWQTILAAALLLFAADGDRDFSGKWLLDMAASNIRGLDQSAIDSAFTISQSDGGILYSTSTAKWSYPLDGSETRKKAGAESRSIATKWEGAALLISSIVTGPQNYSVSDRWTLAREHNTLTVARQMNRGGVESEGTLVYRREGTPTPAAPGDMQSAMRESQPVLRDSPVVRDSQVVLRETPPVAGQQPTLARRPQPALAPDVTVPQGTHVLLSLVGELSTKHAKDGDRVYLRTDSPIYAEGRVVLPRGCDVQGTVTHAKQAGKVAGKGELAVRFDMLILPNGVTRDFRATPHGGEGKLDGDTKAADGRTVLLGAGMGAGVGAIASGAAGAGIGGAVGALAGVFASRQQDIILRAGTHIEMILDRDLVFHSDELPLR